MSTARFYSSTSTFILELEVLVPHDPSPTCCASMTYSLRRPRPAHSRTASPEALVTHKGKAMKHET